MNVSLNLLHHWPSIQKLTPSLYYHVTVLSDIKQQVDNLTYSDVLRQVLMYFKRQRST